MQYATLEEAYPNSNKKQQCSSSSSSKKKDNTNEKFGSDYGTESDCYYDKQGIKMPTCDKFTNPSSATPAPTPAPANNDVNHLRNEYVKKMCSPLQPPDYHLPIDSNSENAFKKALETSLMDMGKVQIDKFSIKPYDFDEYDAYLNINNINTNNKDTSLEYRTTPFLEEYLLGLRDSFNKKKQDQGIKVNNIEQFTNYTKNIKVDVNLYNLFLFIFIGIIIILLCDQITRLAVIVANKNI
jgi:hypothetical protein